MISEKSLKTLLGSKSEAKTGKANLANRGMAFENDIDISNKWYLENHRAAIMKRPTPIKVLRVDYAAQRIKEAIWEKQSTTDYNGVYRGRYIDFEAKSTNVKNNIPVANIKIHQLKHLREVMLHGGIAFCLIEFVVHNEIFLIDCRDLFAYIDEHQPASVPYEYIKKVGHLVPIKFQPRIDYLSIVDAVYF